MIPKGQLCQQYLDFVPNSAYAQDIKNEQQW